MAKNDRIQHEGVVINLAAQTIEVMIQSHSACAGCHAKGACGIAEMKEKVITAQRPEFNVAIGDKVLVYAAMNNAVYSVVLAYVIPSLLILITIFFLQQSGSSELSAAIISLLLLVMYFFILYWCRNKVSQKIIFSIEKIG